MDRRAGPSCPKSSPVEICRVQNVSKCAKYISFEDTLHVYFTNALVYVYKDQDIHIVNYNDKVDGNENLKKTILHKFFYT